MINVSRRAIASYAADELLAGESVRSLSRRLAAVLVANKGLNELDLLVDDIVQILEERGKLAKAVVTSAKPLTPQLRQKLTQQIRTAAKVDKVFLAEEIDESLIGGVRVETANHSWDKSLARQLSMIKGGF